MQVWRPGEQYQATGSIALHFVFFSFKTRSPSELAVIDSIGFAAGESQRCSCFSLWSPGITTMGCFTYLYFIFYNMGLGLGPRPLYLHDKHFVNWFIFAALKNSFYLKYGVPPIWDSEYKEIKIWETWLKGLFLTHRWPSPIWNSKDHGVLFLEKKKKNLLFSISEKFIIGTKIQHTRNKALCYLWALLISWLFLLVNSFKTDFFAFILTKIITAQI